MSLPHRFAMLVVSAGLLAGCAANPADSVPKAGVSTPGAASTTAAQADGATATPLAGTTATPSTSGTPSASAGTALPLAEGTEVSFKGSKVTGSHDGGFRKVSGTVTVDGEDLSKAGVDVTIDMTSVYSDDEKLTQHLSSPDFFDVAKYPTATFKSTSITKADTGYTVAGDLTLHGVTKGISFPAEIALSGGELTAKAEFAINRKDFEIVYPGKPDDLIRDEVVIKFDLKAGAPQG